MLSVGRVVRCRNCSLRVRGVAST
eukprot:COSAG02_NODE_68170_length_251_cov_0.677632_1_plen_23_part_10